jgi:hypothetical protein
MQLYVSPGTWTKSLSPPSLACRSLGEGGFLSAAVVAILVIFVIVAAAALFMFGGQFIGGKGGGETKKVDVNIKAPAVPSKSP